MRMLWCGSLQPVFDPHVERAREQRRALAISDHRRDSRRLGQLRAAIDRRHGEIELGTVAATRERDANRMKQCLALLTRSRLHPIRDRSKRLAIETRRRGELL